jgi:hypothetical protein
LFLPERIRSASWPWNGSRQRSFHFGDDLIDLTFGCRSQPD